MQPFELTLIVAATRSMGIGLNGSMPWSGLRKEMQYFARVTTRIPSPATINPAAVNAVIMGRKTWDSIPAKFRPLKDRLNIVVTRSAPHTPPNPDLDPRAEAVRVPSFEAAVQYARARADVARVFIIGGAQIYDAALKVPEAQRVLLTSIQRDFECDTFFPLKLGDPSVKDWVQRSRDELNQWTGEDTAEGGQEEAGTKYEFQMWEKTG